MPDPPPEVDAEKLTSSGSGREDVTANPVRIRDDLMPKYERRNREVMAHDNRCKGYT